MSGSVCYLDICTCAFTESTCMSGSVCYLGTCTCMCMLHVYTLYICLCT